MRPEGTFLRVLRRSWLGLNIAVLLVTASGLLDATAMSVMLSFPAGVVAIAGLVMATDAGVWIHREFNLLVGVVIVASGYVQWFVVGRALAKRILVRLSVSRRVRVMLRAGVVFAFVALGAVGFELVRAQEQQNLLARRASGVHAGMSVQEVRQILGEPKHVRVRTAETEHLVLCDGPAVRTESYWYEHPWRPQRLPRTGLDVTVCFDAQGTVVDVSVAKVN